MSLKKINTVLAAAFLLFILWFGSEFILRPETVAPGFGLPSWPSGDGGGFLIVKGTRDVVMALVLGVLLVAGHRRALGWAMLVEALAAYGDMANVLAHRLLDQRHIRLPPSPSHVNQELAQEGQNGLRPCI
ncbi:hypothetical protein GCM10022384_48590 [Streptomyces marokkonensis]|uniref:DUF4267 domain-containing protein n=1 Tax=Streptomyces marokkonensis TaxID=324855 RepID=A0ABP7RCU0_9ACTN